MVAIRHVVSLLSNSGSSSNASSLELLLGVRGRVTRLAWNAIVLGVLAALFRGMAYPLLGVVFTFEMVGGAINNLGDWLSFLRKDLLPGPLLLSFKFGFTGVFLRIRSVGLPIFLLVLLRSSRKPKFIDLCREGKHLLLFLSGCAPFSSKESSLVLVFCSIHEGGNGNVGSFVICVLLALDELSKVLVMRHLVALEDVDKKVVGGFPPSLK
jgi:hypothetical protein